MTTTVGKSAEFQYSDKLIVHGSPLSLEDTSELGFGLAALRPMAKAKLTILRVLML